MRVYVVRHAQSANNALSVPSLMNPDRDSDPTLTETGFKQAAALGKFVGERFGDGAVADGSIPGKHQIKKLLVSPMRRCMLTATPMSAKLGVPITVRADMHEHGGCFDGSPGSVGGVVGRPGLTKAQLEREFPGCVVPVELIKGWWSEQSGCETVPQAQARVLQVKQWLWEMADGWKEKDGAVCLVVHGMFIDILLKAMSGVNLTSGKQQVVFCSQNACVHVLELNSGSPQNLGRVCGIQRFNGVDHLPISIQTGGSLEGMDDCYVNEGSA